jgi:anti-sigma factor RsiW
MNQSDEVFSRHRRAWESIPWVVNGRAPAEERRFVEQHLAVCGDCREEFQFQSRLHAAMRVECQQEADPEMPLRRLLQRIDGVDVGTAMPLPRRRVAVSSLARGLLVAVVVEAVGLAALSGALWTRAVPVQTAYRTLSAAEAPVARASFRVVLAPSLKLSELQDLLQQLQLQIVGGPGDSGIDLLAPLSVTAAVPSEVALAQLRAYPGVRLAEPVDAQPKP